MDLYSICSKGTSYGTRKRIGRGSGSGSGKTSGRGHKGWGARSGSSKRPGYEGGQMPIYRRVPKRGFTNARFRTEYTVINVQRLDVFEDGATVDLESILARGLVSLNTKELKVLGNGELTRKLTVRAHKFSKSAAEKIAAAGGEAVLLDRKGAVVIEDAAPARKPAKAKARAKAKPSEAPVDEPDTAPEPESGDEEK